MTGSGRSRLVGAGMPENADFKGISQGGCAQAENPDPRLHPVEPAAIHTTAEERLTVEQWLLSTVPSSGRDRIRTEWQEHTVAVLPLGNLFSAVRLPGSLVQAAGLMRGKLDRAQIDAFLDEALDGGPVICDPQGHRYYALVPANMPESYKAAAEDWHPLRVGILGRGTYLGVPPLHVTEFDKETCVSYWSVPLQSPPTLCTPLNVARLVAAAMQWLPVGGES